MLIIGAAISIPFWSHEFWAEKFGHTIVVREMQNLASIATAIRSYQQEFNIEPPTPPRQFFASLRGANPKGYTFLASPKHAESEAGVFLDEWRNHYQILFIDGVWNVCSAGPNRILDGGVGGDDISIKVPATHK